MSEQPISPAAAPLIFLGVADHVRMQREILPLVCVDVYGLTQVKSFRVYPISLQDLRWLFLVNLEQLSTTCGRKLDIHLVSPEGETTAKGLLELKPPRPVGDPVSTKRGTPDELMPDGVWVLKGQVWFMWHATFPAVLANPGKHAVVLAQDGPELVLGYIDFQYTPTPPFTGEQIRAIKADPRAAKGVKVELGCKHCETKLVAYAGLDRIKDWEAQGCTWQHDLPNVFECKCGKTKYSLDIYRESLHGLLGSEVDAVTGKMRFENRYRHTQILSIVQQFNKLLESETAEAPFQEFLEDNPVMLARFNPKRIYLKQGILGRWIVDFAVLDTQNNLVLVELECPNLPLFKQNGHPTAKLMHAYGQLADWLREYRIDPPAFLRCFELKPEDVMAVRGVVIAGRRDATATQALQRHLSLPIYQGVDFMTLDDLANSVLLISRALAGV